MSEPSLIINWFFQTISDKELPQILTGNFLLLELSPNHHRDSGNW